MIRGMNRRRKHGLRIVLAAGFCLLFQPLAVAAHDCPGSPSMQVGAGESARCASHCAPDSPAPVDLAKSAMAVATLAPFAGFIVFAAPPARLAAFAAPRSTADPPPRLRYCSLLI